MEDLEQVNPKGRFDVLVYRGVQAFLETLEKNHGIAGIWDNAKPLINEVVTNHVSGFEIPREAKMILGIMQANWKGGGK